MGLELGQEVAAIGIILGGVMFLYGYLDYLYCLYFHKFEEDNPNLSKRLDKTKGVRK